MYIVTCKALTTVSLVPTVWPPYHGDCDMTGSTPCAVPRVPVSYCVTGCLYFFIPGAILDSFFVGSNRCWPTRIFVNTWPWVYLLIC